MKKMFVWLQYPSFSRYLIMIAAMLCMTFSVYANAKWIERPLKDEFGDTMGIYYALSIVGTYTSPYLQGKAEVKLGYSKGNLGISFRDLEDDMLDYFYGYENVSFKVKKNGRTIELAARPSRNGVCVFLVSPNRLFELASDSDLPVVINIDSTTYRFTIPKTNKPD